MGLGYSQAGMPVAASPYPDPGPARRDSLPLARLVFRRVHQLVCPVFARRRRQRMPGWHRDLAALAASRARLAVLARSLSRLTGFEGTSLLGHGVISK